MKTGLLILRLALAVILLAHSIPGMLNGGVNNFGRYFLNEIGFAPFGILFAWLIKLSHVFSAVFLILNKYIKPIGVLNIFILIMGIVFVHFEEGWFVVGGGTNGMEYNFALICMLLATMFPDGFTKPKK